MRNWRFWEKPKTDERRDEDESAPRTASIDGPQPIPPKPRPQPPITGEMRQRKRAELERRRDALGFDIEQGELALQPDNPWRQRVDLLNESLATIDADRARLDAQPPLPTWPLPPTPITAIQATNEEPADIRFRIDGEAFHFAEETDWAERGTTVVRGQLSHRAGEMSAIVPSNVPPDRREALARHLADSVFVFATDLRDRALAGEPLPTAPTLADLAQPCPECGGWRDWHGRCAECTRRAFERQQLHAEAERLRREQSNEEEERHRWAERLSFARRRLADVEAELATLNG